MKNVIPNLCLVVGLAVAPCAGAGTQVGGPQTTDPKAERPAATATQKSAATAKSLTVTGCLREVSDKPGSFVLIRQAAGTPSGDRTKAAASSADPLLYRLTQGIGVELGPHVGRELQVSGSLAKSAAQSALPQGKVMASVNSADAMGAPEITVSSFQVVAQACQPSASK